MSLYSHSSQYGHHGRHHHNSTSSQHSYRDPRYAQPLVGGYGGYGPPPNADPQLWQWFSTVDTDRSGQISLNELQAALVNEFDLDTVKMLMNMFDADRSGTIGFNEFAGLWKYIADWQNVFRHFDRDGSGSIEGHELSEALRSFGYNLSPRLLQLIELKYATGPASGYAPPAGISFDRFVRACVVVKSLTEAFQQLDTDRDGWIQVSYQQFMEMFLRAP
ncbi:EF-hand [Neolentinus lepideus HHB14362 ss-1]|uniref:EF-hand n=1 Tax=Neolentinus lepideus HHB14362 ss-1 TaxID=1314782 RepID=A0A165UPN6_9AGAM|nr:EF-hand [Neolentinus lepideus HHB14362 ss-1]